MSRSVAVSKPRTLVQTLLLLQLVFVTVVSAGHNASSASSGSMDDDDDDANKTAKHLFESANSIKVGPGFIAAAAIIVGMPICLAGYRLFRPTVFACGFIVGGVFLSGVAEAAFKSQTWMVTASWIAFFIGGIALGSLVIYLYNAGIFLGGAAAGVLLAFTLNTSIGPKLYPNNSDVVLVIMAVIFGIAAGVLALKLERPVLVVATSFVGAELFVAGIGYFAGSYPTGTDFNEFRTADKKDGEWVYEIPTAWWCYVGGAIALFIIGMIVQFKKTAHGHDHGKSRAVPQKGAAPQNAVQYGNPVSHV